VPVDKKVTDHAAKLENLVPWLSIKQPSVGGNSSLNLNTKINVKHEWRSIAMLKLNLAHTAALTS
jgi:hypothetical protein